MPTLTNRWAVLALLFFANLVVAMQFQSVAAFAPIITQEESLSYTQVGMLTGLFMLAGGFVALPSGLLGVWIGDRAVMAIGLFLMLLGSLLFAFSGSMTIMSASRLLGGAGGAMFFVQRTKVVTDWFVGREISTALATLASSFGLGVGIALPVLGGLAEAASWQVAVHFTSALTALSLAIVILFYQNPPKAEPSPRKATGGTKPVWLLPWKETILILVAGKPLALFVSGYIVFMSYAPLLLIERGYSTTEAAFLVSLVALVSLGSMPLGGYLTDRFGKPNWFIAGGAAATAAACFIFPLWGPPLLWIVLFGLFRGGCLGGIMALPSEVLRPEHRSVGIGLFLTVFYAGMALMPLIAGTIQDASESAASALWFGGALWLMIIVMLLIFRLLQRSLLPDGIAPAAPEAAV